MQNFIHVTSAVSARRFTIVSTCPDPWGGSEELWSGAAQVLSANGHRLSIFKTSLDQTHPRIQQLKSLSCKVRNLRRLPAPQPLITRSHLFSMAVHLTVRRPDLVIISQGDNYDGLHFGYLCRKLRIPYALVSHKAADHFWPPDKSRRYRREVFAGAVRCFFVSEHNWRLTEEQNGMTLTNAEVVRNPYLVTADGPLPWPGREMECLRLACVARLYLLDKGQDILLRVLAGEKWKGRKLHVSFYGSGVNGEALADLAARLGLRNVSFEGQTEDVLGIWKNHHALVLPSRAEGMPLALVEAMMCGRPCVVTKVGGNAEVVQDGVTGFLATPDEDSIDAALEEAWGRREELREMGQRAALRIRELVPASPAEDFAETLLDLTNASDSRAALGLGVRAHD
ncbi:MAG: group 1 glycosyl transferase [Acidobacteria bacterium]|nr:MAG: group 1 glycosyl transferase [Acidobacteriota bacterium]